LWNSTDDWLIRNPFFQDTPHRGAADVEAAGDSRFAESGTTQLADLIRLQGDGNGSTQSFAVLPGIGQASAHAFAQNFVLKLGKHGQQTGHGPTGGRCQVQRLGQ
jgi:hypothetical protein